MTRPRFCPNCGAAFPEKSVDVDYNIQPYGPGPSIAPEHITGYDCYCKACKWSGDIEPDGEDRP